MVGMNAILIDRQHASKVLGPRFDIRGFHNAVLHNGFIPLWAVKESVDAWIADRNRAH
jgi:uncharacterized protein (DUF885 family)